MCCSSSSLGVPITSKMTLNWSVLDDGKPALRILVWWSGDRGKQELPGNRGLLSIKVGAFSRCIPHSSPMMQPTLHTSIALVYSLSKRMSSGALYHLVTTCPVNSFFKGPIDLALVSFPLTGFGSGAVSIGLGCSSTSMEDSVVDCLVSDDFVSSGTLRAKPKSQILTSQSSLSRIFAGLRSLWRTLALWMYFMPHMILYMMS
mmetsp:Transcript_935/g.2209  ORF Transcript_935/g.2209 Transcript_935/m.2209 type:complete len:203 (-) Transcript_935:2036-2644(-)